MCPYITVFENHRKSLIQHCQRSELRLHFEWTKVNWKCQKWSILTSLWKCQKSKFKCDILSSFQTMCIYIIILSNRSKILFPRKVRGPKPTRLIHRPTTFFDRIAFTMHMWKSLYVCSSCHTLLIYFRCYRPFRCKSKWNKGTHSFFSSL